MSLGRSSTTASHWGKMLAAKLQPGHSRQMRCPDCRLPAPQCLCAEITRAPCEIEIIVLRHVLERERNSNTGSLVSRALQGARLLEYASPEHGWDPQELCMPNTSLLYPKPGVSQPARLPSRLVILDATWPQARRMSQRIPELRGMPTLALPPPSQVLPRMRDGAAPEQMSTAESTVAALRLLGQDGPADHLERLLRELVRRFSLPQRRI